MIPLKDDVPSYSFPFVTIALIAANVLVFLYQISLGGRGQEAFVYGAAAIPYQIAHLKITSASLVPPPFTILTAMFIHGGLLHLGGNMLFLWIFGDNVEDTLGHFKFLLFYLGTGIVASLTQIFADPASTVPMIGASGAIAGVLGAYFLLFPRAKIFTLVFLVIFVTVIRIPAVIFLGLWFLIQVLSSGFESGVAWYAHIGGFIAGAAAIIVLRHKRPRNIFGA